MRILVVALILVLALGCFTACSNSNNNAQPTVPTNGGSEGDHSHYDWHGLHYNLTEDFTVVPVENEECASYTNGTISLTIDNDTTPAGVTDSKSYAMHYATLMNANYTVSTANKNGVYYTVVNFGNGTMEARSFYVDADRCWVMYGTSPDFAKNLNNIISIITSATIG